MSPRRVARAQVARPTIITSVTTIATIRGSRACTSNNKLATTPPDAIAASAPAMTPATVSYTHLTLPTNREV